jgi:lysozyme
MKINNDGIKILHKFEGLKLEAYECPASLKLAEEKKTWTIGYGNTRYEDGSLVKKGDKITKKRAKQLFTAIVDNFSKNVTKRLKVILNENQFSALVSFAYNVGIGNFTRSTLLKLVNENPNDSEIRNQFMRWNKVGGKPSNGLTNRRKEEADLYYKNI